MDYKYLKIKEFENRWFSVRFTFKISDSHRFGVLKRKKEVRFWYYPSKTVNLEKSHTPDTWDRHLDSCYDLGVAINDVSSWISLKIKNRKI